MQVVEVKINAMSAGEEVVANFTIEERKGETWNKKRVVTVTSGSPESTRSFPLADNERLIIDGKATAAVIYDRDQNMAKKVDADPQVRAAQQNADDAQRRANEMREKELQAARDANRASVPSGSPTPDKPVVTQGGVGGQAPTGATGPAPAAKPGTNQAQPTASAAKPMGSDTGQGARGTNDQKEEKKA